MLFYLDFEDFECYFIGVEDFVVMIVCFVVFGESLVWLFFVEEVFVNYFEFIGILVVCGWIFICIESMLWVFVCLVVLGYDFWEDVFGVDENVIG